MTAQRKHKDDFSEVFFFIDFIKDSLERVSKNKSMLKNEIKDLYEKLPREKGNAKLESLRQDIYSYKNQLPGYLFIVVEYLEIIKGLSNKAQSLKSEPSKELFFEIMGYLVGINSFLHFITKEKENLFIRFLIIMKNKEMEDKEFLSEIQSKLRQLKDTSDNYKKRIFHFKF